MTDSMLELGDPDGNALWRRTWRDRGAAGAARGVVH